MYIRGSKNYSLNILINDIKSNQIKEISNYLSDDYEHDNLKYILYENYHTLCSFKHFAPFVVGTEFPVKNNFLEAFKDDYKVIACSCVYSALLVTFTVLNRHGEKFRI